MNQFFLEQGISNELQEFRHVIEFALKKNSTIQLNSLNITATGSLRIYHIIDGKFEWIIGDQHHILYPDDLVLILPGQNFGGANGVMDVGTVCWLHLEVEKPDEAQKNLIGKWSMLGNNERVTIAKLLFLNNTSVLSKVKEAGPLFQELRHELSSQQIGYKTRVNQLIDELFILIARKLTHQDNSYRDFPQTFLKLETRLRQNLAHHWTVEEMAGLVGLGTTSFTEKVKNYTGFSPLNYLITIRISEAIKLLKQHELSVTDIALDTGFYSSQHFSTTFKKLTGYTPSEFRKRNSSNN